MFTMKCLEKMYNEAGESKAIGNCYESFGIIVNTKLLADAGYTPADITGFEILKAVVTFKCRIF